MDSKCEWIRAINETLTESVYEDSYDNEIIKELFKIISKSKTTPEEHAKMKDEYNQKRFERETIHKNRIENARNLKALGILTNEQIASAIGLNLKEVQTV
ncbi:MAG: hypothetical protein B6247_10165 [Candidatus Parabeggiatoa sp. nov. 2]|nr:MAG: hypothetical protein B6247_10165 [Beggiatoa sp. 4572_84]